MIVHRLPVDGGHVLHVEEHGNPAGPPLLVLHGGPGSGGSPAQRAFIDATRYRILCPDQRGAGLSTPRGSIQDNTLPHLLADLRLLRDHLRVERWLVAGGSWGATLALLHAIDQPQAVSGLLLRNPYLARAEDDDHFFSTAGRARTPGWGRLQERAGAAERSMPVYLAGLFANGTEAAQREAAMSWWAHEQHLAGGKVGTPDAGTLARLVDRYRILSHYVRHGCWLGDRPLLERCAALPAVPVHIVQGADDAICPPAGATTLAQALGRRASLRIVPGAGHDPTHPAMVEAMREALHAHEAQQGLP